MKKRLVKALVVVSLLVILVVIGNWANLLCMVEIEEKCEDEKESYLYSTLNHMVSEAPTEAAIQINFWLISELDLKRRITERKQEKWKVIDELIQQFAIQAVLAEEQCDEKYYIFTLKKIQHFAQSSNAHSRNSDSRVPVEKIKKILSDGQRKRKYEVEKKCDFSDLSLQQ